MSDKPITVVSLLIERLKSADLQRLFGVPGGSSMDLVDAARRAGLEFVLTRHEDSGMVMAVVTAWPCRNRSTRCQRSQTIGT